METTLDEVTRGVRVRVVAVEHNHPVTGRDRVWYRRLRGDRQGRTHVLEVSNTNGQALVPGDIIVLGLSVVG